MNIDIRDCTRCKESKPLDKFRAFVNNGEVKGRRCVCKACESKIQVLRYRKANIDRLIISCGSCGKSFQKRGRSLTCSKECSRLNKNSKQRAINEINKKPRKEKSIRIKEVQQPTREVKMLQMDRKPGKIYLDNIELYKEILVSKEMGILTPRAAEMFQMIGKGIIKKFRYSDPDNKMDSYQCGMLKMFKFWYNFDELKSHNPFAYYSEIFKRGMVEGFNEIRGGKKDHSHLSIDSQDYYSNYI